MDFSGRVPSSFFGSRSVKLNHDRSFGHHRDADHKNTQTGWKEHHTKLTKFVDSMPLEPPLISLSPSSSWNGPSPSYWRSVSLFLPGKRMRDGYNNPHGSPFVEQFHILPELCSYLYLQENASFSTLVLSHAFFCGELFVVTSCSIPRKSSC